MLTDLHQNELGKCRRCKFAEVNISDGFADAGDLGVIEAGRENFASLEKLMLDKGEATANTSGRQEFLENLINEFI